MRRARTILRIAVGTLFLPLTVAAQSPTVPPAATTLDHRVLATNKTSTMEKELNEAAEAGFRFQAVMGGDSAFGGKEVVVIMTRGATEKGRYSYKLLATSKTSTMQKELQDASDASFEYRGQTVFGSAFEIGRASCRERVSKQV